MSRAVRDRLALALILAVAIVLRIGAACWWENRLGNDTQFGFGDSETYWILAQSIAHREPYQYKSPERRCIRTPGYPAILAPLFLVDNQEPSVFSARLVGATLGTVTVGLVYWLACLLFDVRTGLAAAAIVAVYPGAIAMCAFVLTETPFAVLMLLQLILWTYGWRSENRAAFAIYLLGAGLVSGLATLVRPSWLLFTPFALIVAMLFSAQRRRHLYAATLLLTGLVVAMSPWWLRNARLYGRFVPTSLEVGASLYDGLNPQADGSSNMDFVPEITEQLRQSIDEPRPDAEIDAHAAFELRLNQEYRDRAIGWAKENPGSALKLSAIKFSRMWNIWPNEAGFRSYIGRGVVLLSYVPVLAFAMWGAMRYCRDGWTYQLCILPAVYFTLLHIVFVSSIRYRQPAMLTLIVLAAAMVIQLIDQRSTPQPTSPTESK